MHGPFICVLNQTQIRQKGHNMKISYKFTTGEVMEVEVSDEIGTVIIESRRKEENLARKERYHCYSYDAIEFEGKEYADWDTPENTMLQRYEDSVLANAVSKLSEVQKKRLMMLSEGLSMREIARREGVSYISVRESIAQARKKIKKFI